MWKLSVRTVLMNNPNTNPLGRETSPPPIPKNLEGTHIAGFTLLEVLIALIVLTIALGAGIQTVTTFTRNAANLKYHTQARWVAANEITSWQVMKRWGAKSGPTSGTSQMGRATFSYETSISATPEPTMQRLVVKVGPEHDKFSPPLAVLDAFIGKVSLQ